MTRLPLHTLESAPEGSRAALEASAKAWGFVSNLHGTLAESPAALVGYDTLFAGIAKSTLTPVEQQVVFLTVSTFHDCSYCTAGHTYLARAAGMDEDSLRALRAEALPADPRLAILSDFARKVVETRGNPGDAAVGGFIAAGFTTANVLDVVAMVAAKTISNYVNHLTHTPLEGFMSDPALGWTKSTPVAA